MLPQTRFTGFENPLDVLGGKLIPQMRMLEHVLHNRASVCHTDQRRSLSRDGIQNYLADNVRKLGILVLNDGGAFSATERHLVTGILEKCQSCSECTGQDRVQLNVFFRRVCIATHRSNSA